MSFPSLKSMLLSVVAALVMMTSTSCIDIIERIIVNKDGSGTYEMEIDMGGMLAMMGAFTEGDEDEEDEEEYEKYDSLFYYKDSPDSIKALWTNKEMMEKSVITLHADEENLEMSLTIKTEFDKVSDITVFQGDMEHIGDGGSFFNDMGEDEEDEGGGFGSLGDGEPVEFSMKKGVFSRGEDDVSYFGEMDKDTRQMMEMFFADANYTVEITLPDDIKKSSSKAYKVKGNKATAKVNLLEYLQGKGKLKTDIKF